MAANDITYGPPVALPNVTRLNSIADSAGVAFGEIAGAGELGNNIVLTIPINASANSGTYDVYLCESQDGTIWTDGIDPATAGDQSAKRSDVVYQYSASTVYDASNRTEATFHIQIPMLVSTKNIGIFVVNNSGQTIPSTGASGNSVPYTIASA